ncbi:MAG: hypothetical protein IJ224_00975 [Lachnospiraceae bacterium]|nr:hypothetical protein [Lachnospiraceae bacterium]
MDEHIVEGYYFEDIREANKAKKEYFNICKLKGTISFDDLQGLKNLYLKLSSKKYFTTPIGYAFLQEMREYLVENMGDDNLPLISVERSNVVKVPEVINEKHPEISSEKYKKLRSEYSKIKRGKKILQIAVVSLVIVIAGMFYIMATNKNIGYFNTEEKIVNKYAAWEERLENREYELDLREDELDLREQEIINRELNN